MKVTSFWYKDGDGKDFHYHNKCMVMMGVLTNKESLNMFKNLIIRKEWLRDDGTPALPSHIMMRRMHAEYIRSMPRLLKGCGRLNQLAIKKLADFLLLLFESDDMYYERMGYLIWRFIQMGPSWLAADLEGRKYILHLERLNYFVNEHREDRITHLTMGWDYMEDQYASDIGVQRSVDWIVEWLHMHAGEFNYDEVGRLGMQQFHPDQWYPVGRGGLWDAIHAGNG